MSTALAVKKAFMFLGNSPSSGVEAFLGNDRDPLVAILGYNPGLNGAPHRIGAPTNPVGMDQALRYFRTYLQGDNFASHEFNTVWRRYRWMLDPGAATWPHTEEDFKRLAPNQLLVLNLHQSQTTRAGKLTREQRQGKGEVARDLLVSARPRVLVAQGADAWRWIRSQTRRVDGRPHASSKLCDIYPGHPVGEVGYLVQFKDKRIPALPVLPVFHLTGQEQYRPKATRFAALESRYREELNRLFSASPARGPASPERPL